MAIRKSSISGVPFGNSASRPSSPSIGQTYYNGELGYQEIYTDAGWIAASGGNDFNLNIGGTYTTVTFTQSYSSGSYSIVSNNNDITMDIYAFALDGSLAGYTSTKSFTATQRFNKMVVIGGTNGDVLTFTYKTTYATTNTTSEVAAGAYILSTTPTALNSINDTTVISGGNFANNVAVYFVGSDNAERPAKSIVRSSSSQLIVTRPDDFPTTLGTYKLIVENVGVSRPIGSSLHILNNAITAGTTPNWTTSTTLPAFTKNVSYSTTLLATDTEATDIDYSIISGSLPTGLVLNNETGVISGTNTSDVTGTTFTVRAVDAGGNFVDRTFTLPNIGPAAPVWITSEAIGTVAQGSGDFTSALSASDDSGTVTYSIDTNIAGAFINGNILTIPASNYSTTIAPVSVIVKATDLNGTITTRTFTLTVIPTGGALYQTPGTYSWTAPTGVTSVNVVAVGGGASGRQVDGGAGGGGGGLGWKNSIPVTPGSSYTVVVGAGGADTVTFNSVAGGDSYFISTATVRGGGGSAGVQTNTGTGSLGATGGTFTGDGGGNGGRGRNGYLNAYAGGGGGAGGYSGAGGNAGSYVKTGTETDPKTGAQFDIIEAVAATAAAASSGGGGGGGGSTSTARGGGGGVGIYGRGADGALGTANAESANGGSGGTAGGLLGGGALGQGGSFGGGGSGSDTTGSASACKGGGGAVRITWGLNRSFPTTNVGQNYLGIAETII